MKWPVVTCNANEAKCNNRMSKVLDSQLYGSTHIDYIKHFLEFWQGYWSISLLERCFHFGPIGQKIIALFSLLDGCCPEILTYPCHKQPHPHMTRVPFALQFPPIFRSIFHKACLPFSVSVSPFCLNSIRSEKRKIFLSREKCLSFLPLSHLFRKHQATSETLGLWKRERSQGTLDPLGNQACRFLYVQKGSKYGNRLSIYRMSSVCV